MKFAQYWNAALKKVIFQEADADDDGQITFEEFEMFLNKYPGVAENLNITYVIYSF
jgi:Ca2+-binding EF-hand superfamily protein